MVSCSSTTAEVAIIQCVTPRPIMLKSFTVSIFPYTPTPVLSLSSLTPPPPPPPRFRSELVPPLCPWLVMAYVMHSEGYAYMYTFKLSLLNKYISHMYVFIHFSKPHTDMYYNTCRWTLRASSLSVMLLGKPWVQSPHHARAPPSSSLPHIPHSWTQFGWAHRMESNEKQNVKIYLDN